MGVEIFERARDYKDWLNGQDNKEVVSVVVFDGQLIVTWKFV